MLANQFYEVEFGGDSEKYYIKKFRKKYKSNWDKTQQDIVDVCRRIDSMIKYNRVDIISSVDQYKILKLDFKVEGTDTSAKKSGNRVILLVDEDSHKVTILIVYSKNDIGPPNETVKWRKLATKLYPNISII